jgi:hypothetical protein
MRRTARPHVQRAVDVPLGLTRCLTPERDRIAKEELVDPLEQRQVGDRDTVSQRSLQRIGAERCYLRRDAARARPADVRQELQHRLFTCGRRLDSPWLAMAQVAFSAVTLSRVVLPEIALLEISVTFGPLDPFEARGARRERHGDRAEQVAVERGPDARRRATALAAIADR